MINRISSYEKVVQYSKDNPDKTIYIWMNDWGEVYWGDDFATQYDEIIGELENGVDRYE